jgi:pimeloyl-ACP methyl ester carboxylesterase
MNARPFTFRLTATALLLVAGTVLAGRPAQAAAPIEAHYAVAGPSSVATAVVTDGSGAAIYDLFYPADLPISSALDPIITWGNGTGAVPSQYSGVLDQLASWGFVVIASTSTSTGTGSEMIAGAQYLVNQDSNPDSIFFRKLNTAKIGAVGHSQGAGGAILTATKTGGLITTIVPINLPDPIFVLGPGTQFDISKVNGPTLLLGGQLDVIALPLFLQLYYDQIPGPAAIAILNGAGHLTIQGTGGGYLGYLTAWMRYQLDNDSYASVAFTGTSPELNNNPAWSQTAEKHLS